LLYSISVIFISGIRDLNPFVRTNKYKIPSENQILPNMIEYQSKLINNKISKTAPVSGINKYKIKSLNVLFFLFTKNKTITEIFTKIKARNAPKLINDATNDKLKNNDGNDKKLINRILFVGVLCFLFSFPKNRLGNCPSRPIAYKTRAALACEDIAEPNTTIAVIAKNIVFNTFPPTRPIMSYEAESGSVKLI